MQSSRRCTAGLVLAFVGYFFILFGISLVGLALHIAGIILAVQGWQDGESHLLCLLCLAMNGLGCVLSLIFWAVGSLVSWFFSLIF